MEQKNKNIDELFSGQLGNHTEVPPPSVWDALEKRLDDQPRRKRILWWPLIGLMLLVSSVAGYYVYHNEFRMPAGNEETSSPAVEKHPGTEPVRYNGKNDTDTGILDNADSNAVRQADTMLSPGDSGTGNLSSYQPSGKGIGGISVASSNETAVPRPGNGSAGAIHDNGQKGTTGNNGRNKNATATDTEEQKNKTGSVNNTQNSAGVPGGKNDPGVSPSSQNILPGKAMNNQPATVTVPGNSRNKKNGKTATTARNTNLDAGSNGNDAGNMVNATTRGEPGSPNEPLEKPGSNGTKKSPTAAAKNGTKNTTAAKTGTNAPNNASTGSAVFNDKAQQPLPGSKNNGPKNNIAAKAATNGNKQAGNAANDVGRGNNDAAGKPAPAGNKEAQRGQGENDQPKTPAVAPQKTFLASKPEEIKDGRNSGIPVAQYMNGKDDAQKGGVDQGTDEDDEENKNIANGDDQGGGGGGGATSTPPVKKQSNISAGVKAGYERGTNAYTAGKYTGGIYVQYNLSPKVGVMLQPTVKIAKTNNDQKTTQGYYNITSNIHDAIQDQQDTAKYHHTYTQVYDTVIVSHARERSFTEVDIPLLLTYKVDKNLKLLVGLNLSFGKILQVKEDISRQSRTRTYTNTDSSKAPQPFNSIFQHTGEDFSKYDPSAYGNAATNPMRFGYMIGISYLLNNRFLFDLSLQQTISNQSYIPDADIRKLYSQPYFRFSLGYQLFGPKPEPKQ